MQGICKWFDAKKGFGFVNCPEVTDDDGNQRDIFVHWTKITMEGFKKIEQGETVEFDLIHAEAHSARSRLPEDGLARE